MQRITDKAASRIKGNHRIMGKLVTHFDKHYRSIELWIDAKDIRLTTPDAVKLIAQETGLKPSEILQNEVATRA